MKKVLSLLTMLVIVLACVTAGTFAVYTVKNESTESTMSSYEFKMTSTGLNSFDANVKLAPTMSKSYDFTVSNFDGNIVSQTDMDITVTVSLSAPNGSSAIKPLTVILNKIGESSTESVGNNQISNGVGTLTYTDIFNKDTQSTSSFTVVVTWPSTENDIDFAGAGFASSLKVSIVATQKI